MHIIEYTIVMMETATELIHEVRKNLAEGWQPYGTPFQGGKDGTFWFQAMVRYGQ